MRKTTWSGKVWAGFGLLLAANIWLAGLLFTEHPAENTAAANGPQKNIILVSIDSLRADQLGCYDMQGRYGSLSRDRAITPRLDAFARTSSQFVHAYTQGSATFMSHSSMLSGRYPYNIPVYLEPNRALPQNWHSIAQTLQDRGYQTVAWTGGSTLDVQFGFGRGFSTYEMPPWFGVCVQKGIDWLNRQRNPSRPFFMFLHNFDIHPPFKLIGYDRPPREGVTNLLEMSLNSDMDLVHTMLDDPEFFRRIVDSTYYEKYQGVNLLRYAPASLSSSGEKFHPIKLSERTQGYLVDYYRNELQSVDSEFGRLVDELKKLHLEDNTAVVVMGDHGWEFFEYGRYTNGVHGLRSIAQVPLLMRIPGVPPSKVDEVAQLVDITPTLLSWLHLDGAQPVDSQSLLPWMRGEKNLPPRVALTISAYAVNLRTRASEIVYHWPLKSIERYDISRETDERTPVTRLPATDAALFEQRQEEVRKALDLVEDEARAVIRYDLDEKNFAEYRP